MASAAGEAGLLLDDGPVTSVRSLPAASVREVGGRRAGTEAENKSGCSSRKSNRSRQGRRRTQRDQYFLSVVNKLDEIVNDGNDHIVNLVLRVTLFLFFVFTIFNFVRWTGKVAVDLKSVVLAIDIDL